MLIELEIHAVAVIKDMEEFAKISEAIKTLKRSLNLDIRVTDKTKYNYTVKIIEQD